MKPFPVMVLALSLGFSATFAEDGDSATKAPVRASTAKAEDGGEAAQAKVVVYKNASCGCCGSWIEHMRHEGFEVTANNVDNLNAIKEKVGIPHGMGSCHTAQVGGYFIEGHVPAEQVRRLLAEMPQAKGLTVPGMPTGSPGMENGDRVDPYEVHLVKEDGTTTVYAKYP